jgi:hypothetical protein
MKTRANPERDALTEEIRGLKLQVAELEIKIEALTEQTDQTEERNALKRQITNLEISKAKLIEDNDRKMRETTHKVGLVKEKQDQDAAHQKRQIELARQEAVLEVREKNLDGATAEFDKRMEFREQQFDRQVAQWEQHLADFRGMFGDAMKRLPNIDVALSGAIGRPTAADDDDDRPVRRSSRSRKADDDS